MFGIHSKLFIVTVMLDPVIVYQCHSSSCTCTPVDIRDSVNYKEVMKQYKLGPNGGIVTSLNLFATRFDQVMGFVEKRSSEHKLVSLCAVGGGGLTL